MSGFLLRFLLPASLIALFTSPLWLAALALQDQRTVDNATRLSVDDVENAKRLLRANNPRTLRDGERKVVELSERELNLLLSYVLPEGYAGKVELAEGGARLLASLRLPDNPLGRYLNIDFEVVETTGLPGPKELELGRLQLPAWLVRGIVGLADRRLGVRVPEYRELVDSMDAVRLSADGIRVSYRWQASLAGRLQERGRELMLPPELRRRILDYYGVIGAAAGGLPRGASLAELIGPLFARARDQSAAGADPVEENRALLLALGMAMQGGNPERLAGKSGVPAPPRVRGLRVSLRGRGDLAQHFAISAALTAAGGSELADVIGVFKELSDARGGSGFSFADLLADRAGVVLAQRALGDSAARLQRALSNQPGESLFMPPIDRLPEGLQELEFRSRYQDLDTEPYREVSDELERRIQLLELYR